LDALAIEAALVLGPARFPQEHARHPCPAENVKYADFLSSFLSFFLLLLLLLLGYPGGLRLVQALRVALQDFFRPVHEDDQWLLSCLAS
jgi:hypothetical protein